MDIILKAENLKKTYNSRAGEVEALRGVSLEFESGVFYAIIGRSGCGKSTLLNILSGMDKATSGTITVAGKDISSYSDSEMSVFRRRYIGFVFQQFNLLEDYTVKQNITMPLSLDGRHPDEKFLEELTEILEIDDKLKQYANELSGGQQQRVAIARSILVKPRFIFADEPTGNLDKATGEQTMELLISCARRFGGILIIVTHAPDIAAKADRVIRLDDGKVVEQ